MKFRAKKQTLWVLYTQASKTTPKGFYNLDSVSSSFFFYCYSWTPKKTELKEKHIKQISVLNTSTTGMFFFQPAHMHLMLVNSKKLEVLSNHITQGCFNHVSALTPKQSVNLTETSWFIFSKLHIVSMLHICMKTKVIIFRKQQAKIFWTKNPFESLAHVYNIMLDKE